MAKLTFIPDDMTVEVRDGENLLHAAMAAGILVSTSCGGEGTCGKCRMIVDSGEVFSRPSTRLSDAETSQGYVLGCLTEVAGDAVIVIPPESRLSSAPPKSGRRSAEHILCSNDFEVRLPRWDIDPPVGKILVEMSPPSLTDSVADAERLARACRRSHGAKNVEVALPALRRLPEACRKGDWTVTALVKKTDEGQVVLDVEPGDTSSRSYAAAVDVGTTTVEVELVDLTTGQSVDREVDYNGQVSRGEDVISRIILGSTEEGLDALQHLVVTTVASIMEQLLERTGVSRDDLVAYAVAGNTVMTHLLCGLSPASIRSEPYVAPASDLPVIRASDLDLPGAPEAVLFTLPCPASYVGGDIVAGLLASGIPWSSDLSLFIDIGTNGEIVLGNQEWVVACSCSAGPAFEGGGVLHGMRAAAGAVEQVRIDPDSLEPMVLTIGQVRPLGICGSGLIDCVAELFLAGALARNGEFVDDIASPRVREDSNGCEYVVVFAEESGTGSDIVLTEADIANLIRAKAAVFAGISVLMEAVDVDFTDVSEVLVAGAFGRYLELEKVITLGLLPEVPLEKFKFLGNSSLLGARLAATSRAMFQAAHRVAKKTTYLELSANAAFMEMYVSAMFLPHTDLSLFPQAEQRLQAQTRRS